MELERIANLFLVPSGVLVAALSVAESEALKTGVSAIGFLLAMLWTWSAIGTKVCPTTNFERSLRILPWVFGSLWSVSTWVHGWPWVLKMIS